MSEKSTEKSTGGVTGKGFVPGDDPRRGRGPKPGAPNAGRPPNEWKEACMAMGSRKEILERAEEILGDTSHPSWLAVWKFVVEQGYGSAQRRVEVTGDSPVNFAVVVRREA